MPDDSKLTPDEVAFNALVNKTSMNLIEESMRLTSDALASVTSIIMAAGRAAAMSGLPLPIQLQLFASQYDVMLQSINKLNGKPPETPQEIVADDLRKRLSN